MSQELRNTNKLWDTIKGIEIAMLTTVDSHNGAITSRPMATASKGLEDKNIWFFTRTDSSKVDDVESKKQVNLTYVNPSTATYVSVCGCAEVVHDKDLAKKLWSPLLSAYFKKGPEDQDLSLLKVRVERAEIWDVKSGSMDYISHALSSDKEEDVVNYAVHQQFTIGSQPS
eukprot:TRINITY_DN14635_c0_g1_i1.p1 TRINITY_DN14635_c0_g1~~TRINITY_DN14635_c0_g1_i1.p1  ORF type:complete len:171 (-),score=35.15 TRINITY_DN14635_c0_g1_i1:67-579(-)